MSKITLDGNSAATQIAYAFSETAAIYPITPSSNMAELADEFAAKGKKNLFGSTVNVTQLQSEAGAAGTVHGALAAGSLTTTFTCSQGLLLMIPNMYKIAGELLPTVFHVSARALSAHALSIFGDHSDVMACRGTGFAMLCSTSVQEVLDMATVAHMSTLTSSVPFLHFFDGFRTSHEINKVENVDYDILQKLVPNDAIAKFKARALNSQKPHQAGTAQNPDIYFQNREASNIYYDAVEAHVNDALKKFGELTGRKYKTVEYYGPKDATSAIVIMGTGMHTACETINALNKTADSKCGVIVVRLFRPFSTKALVKELPKTIKALAVLDRTKEPGADGEPLYKDVCTALIEEGLADIKVYGGRYGLGGKEFTPAMVKAIVDNLNSDKPKNKFTVGITDDVTKTSLQVPKYNLENKHYSCKFYGLGSDGTVSANKNSIKIIGENTDFNCQAYFEYDSKKSGSLTASHLRFGKLNIDAPYLIMDANFVACHNINFINKYDMLDDLIEGGIFLLNSPYELSELEKILPDSFLKQLKDKKIKFYVVNANKVSEDAGLGKRINVVMQACFFKLTNIIPYANVEDMLIDAAKKTYSKKGEEIVNANVNAIKNATQLMLEVDVTKLKYNKTEVSKLKEDTHYAKFMKPIEQKKGDDLPVSMFSADGFTSTSTSQYEKRGISIDAPAWIKENCIQCNQCSMVCPHAALRPVLINKEQLKNAPACYDTKAALGVVNHEYRIQVDIANCTGCENCVHTCPAKEKALKMVRAVDLAKTEDKNLEFSNSVENPQTIFKPNTLKGSQFLKPYFEFSGACAGCGETPYIKLVSQLFGNRMVIANATGCTSIYSGSAPSCPYTKNKDGHGPAWASSLFEDNAEFGYGIAIAKRKARETLVQKTEEYLKDANSELKPLLTEWLANFNDGEKTYELSKKLLPLLTNTPLAAYKNNFVKESVWCIGGDGWAYDIGYGGLDHVLASGENINILVLDTEVYSNTGGQMSKSTPLGSTAKFANSGKRTPKKDLGMMAINYKNVYVAQVAMGADMSQVVKAIAEAESYNGPSLIIAYAPCINHGINMNKTQESIKKAVECGYWHMYRYNPDLIKQGKNPFILDSKEPTNEYKDFLMGEARYAALQKQDPELAESLFEESKKNAQDRYETYKRLAKTD